MRLILHTAANWLLWAVRQSIPDSAPLKQAEFTTLQLRLVKIGARIRIAFASACPEKALVVHIFQAFSMDLGPPTRARPRAP